MQLFIQCAGFSSKRNSSGLFFLTVKYQQAGFWESIRAKHYSHFYSYKCLWLPGVSGTRAGRDWRWAKFLPRGMKNSMQWYKRASKKLFREQNYLSESWRMILAMIFWAPGRRLVRSSGAFHWLQRKLEITVGGVGSPLHPFFSHVSVLGGSGI